MRTGTKEWTISLIYARRQRAPWWGKIQTSDELLETIRPYGKQLGVNIVPFVSDSEAELVEYVYRVAASTDAYLVNPATYTGYGRTLQCALVDAGRPYAEVHFSILSQWSQVASPAAPIESIFTHQSAGLVMGFRHYSFVGALVAMVLSLDDPDYLGAKAR